MKLNKIISAMCLLSSCSSMAQELITFKAGDVATAEAFNNNFKVTHDATLENAQQIEAASQKADSAEQNVEALTQQIQSLTKTIESLTNNRFEVYMDDYGLLGEVISFGGGINTRAVVKKGDLIFNINGSMISTKAAYYTDEQCTQPVVEASASAQRGLGNVLVAHDKDGGLYTVNEQSTKVDGQSVYSFSPYFESPETPMELRCMEAYQGGNFTGFVPTKIDTPDFVKVEVGQLITYASLLRAISIKHAQ
ncbi:hypothetical protein [Pseudoalteromonas sp. T1lg23B]|uniref:hypothetical protein n=1 Tax=Pseudoalteromonas sp. T1lg23B TaxID=2077097 RepID=UPI000CF74A7D|nr:hypothetical protein [Pseudoalteromonas sp. T1lg23B]